MLIHMNLHTCLCMSHMLCKVIINMQQNQRLQRKEMTKMACFSDFLQNSLLHDPFTVFLRAAVILHITTPLCLTFMFFLYFCILTIPSKGFQLIVLAVFFIRKQADMCYADVFHSADFTNWLRQCQAAAAYTDVVRMSTFQSC